MHHYFMGKASTRPDSRMHCTKSGLHKKEDEERVFVSRESDSLTYKLWNNCSLTFVGEVHRRVTVPNE